MKKLWNAIVGRKQKKPMQPLEQAPAAIIPGDDAAFRETESELINKQDNSTEAQKVFVLAEISARKPASQSPEPSERDPFIKNEIGYLLYFLLDQAQQSDSSGFNKKERQGIRHLLEDRELLDALRVNLSVYKTESDGQERQMSESAVNALHHPDNHQKLTDLLQKTVQAVPDRQVELFLALRFLDLSLGFGFSDMAKVEPPNDIQPVMEQASARQIPNRNEQDMTDGNRGSQAPIEQKAPENLDSLWPPDMSAGEVMSPLKQDAMDRLETITQQLKTRYKGRLPLYMNMFQLADDNSDLPVRKIHEWSIRAYQETARIYLTRMGILGNPKSAVQKDNAQKSDETVSLMRTNRAAQPVANTLDRTPEIQKPEVQGSPMPDMSQVPHHLKQKFHNTVSRLRDLYPDGQIKDLYAASRKLGESVAFLTRSLGFPDRSTFLSSLGFSLEQRQDGRPATNDYEAAIQELKQRYANAEKETNISNLIRANLDLPLKSMANVSLKLFGMSLGSYLLKHGLLQSKQSAESSLKFVGDDRQNDEKRLTIMIATLKERYKDEIPLWQSMQKLMLDNPDLKLSSINSITRKLYNENASQYLIKEGILANRRLLKEHLKETAKEEARLCLEKITGQLLEKYAGQLPLNISVVELSQENPELSIQSINGWAKTDCNETARTYLERTGILVSRSVRSQAKRKTYGTRSKQWDDRAHLYLSERLEQSNAGLPSYYSKRVKLSLVHPHVQQLDLNRTEAAQWQVIHVKDEPEYDDGLYILDYSGHEDRVTVPISIKGVPVKGIAPAAFQGCTARDVSIPGYFTYLPPLVFFNNRHIEVILLGRGLSRLHQTAFLQAENLCMVLAHQPIEWTADDLDSSED